MQINSIAQNPYHDWTGAICRGSNATQISNHFAVNSVGEIYMSGFGIGDLDPDPNVIFEDPNAHSFVMKVDSNLNLIWARPFGNTGSDGVNFYGIKLDSSEEVLLFGNYVGNPDFDPGPNVYNLIPSNSFTNKGFILKLDSAGNFLWAKGFDSNNQCWIKDIEFTAMNQMIACGEFIDQIDFDPGPGTQIELSSTGGMKNGFMLKLDSQGNWIWHKVINSTFNIECSDIELDHFDDIYCSINFNSTIDLDTGPGVNQVTATGGYDDAVLMKFDNLGNDLNYYLIQSSQEDRIYSVKVNALNNVIFGGTFTGTVDFDPGINSLILDDQNGRSFLAALDPNFNLNWAKNFGSPNYSTATVLHLELDQMDNIHIGGLFTETVDMDPSSGVNLITPDYTGGTYGQPAANLGKYTSAGDFVWALSFDGNGGDRVKDIKIDDFGNIYVAGYFWHPHTNDLDKTTDFDPSPQVYQLFPPTTSAHHNYYSRFKLCNSNQPPLPDTLNLTDYFTPCQVDSLPEPTAVHDCLGQMVGIPDVSFPFYEVGDTIVTWTYDDGWGNVSTQVQTIHITGDFNGPTPNISSLSVYEDYCEATPPTPDATDDCKGLIVGTTNVQFPINVVGDTIITWQYDDGHGNVTYQDQLITVHADTTAPDPLWPSLPDLWGNCQVDSSSVVVDAIDQCSGQVIYGVPTPAFPITTPGWSQITWTFTDNDGHESYQTQDVYVNAGSGPSFIDSEYTINANCQLDTLATPQATDFCDTLVDVSTNQIFPISSQGTTIVQYTATNDNGVTADFFVTVIIDDTVAPSIDSNQLQMQTAICEYDTTFTPTAFDSCSGVVLGVPNITFPMTQLGVDTISWTFTDANGNQSTAEQIIEIIDLDNTISINGFDLSANQSNANYQWLDCKTWTPISGEVNQSYTPIENGEYAVIISNAGCTDTSDCIEIEGIGLSELSNQIKIYPNPSQGQFTLQLDDVKTVHVEVTDMHGKQLISTSIDSKSTVFDLTSFERGVYLVHINNENGYFVKRLVLE